jgi:DNA-binding NarL/FixJ family response regulator
MTTAWQILIVEDDPSTRAFFERCIQQSSQMQVWAVADCVGAARQWMATAAAAPDVMLVDLGLPDGSGLDVLRQARAVWPACESLVISMFGDDANVLASIEAGALGYIHKDSTPDDIAQTILDLKAGASPISPMIARRLLTRYREGSNAREPTLLEVDSAHPTATPSVTPAWKPAVSTAPELSAKERGVLDLIARGFSYAEIARLQDVTVHTVQSHIKNLYGKLSVHSRSEAVFEASRLGLLDDTFGPR